MKEKFSEYLDGSKLPTIKFKKYDIPTIYLDACVMIELAKYEKGTCKDSHKQEIGELYNILTKLMQERRVLCLLGNQLQEMGMTKDRESAKLFLYRFTNSELLHPALVQEAELQAGYQALVNNNDTIELSLHTVFKMEKNPSPFIIHVAPIYSPEKADALRREKNSTRDILNKMKATKNVESSFVAQLKKELEADYQLFLDAFANSTISEDAFGRYLNESSKFHNITGETPNADSELHISNLAQYSIFLLSPYHDILPYIWIRANLWAHLMQRSNKIKHSDNLDIQWAAAYLPFVDYAVTDHAFCELLQSSGLSDLYGTKVYSLRTLNDLLEVLRNTPYAIG